MRNYELVFVVKPNADEETREAVLNKVKEVVATNGEVALLLKRRCYYEPCCINW